MSDVLELWELPDGWTWAEFQQVAKVASNLVDPAAFQNAPHIAPNHIESGTGKLLSYASIADDGVKSAKHRFFAGHILYSKIRPYLCKAVVVDFDGLCSADMYPIVSAIDTDYLHRWMLTKAFTEMTSKYEGRTLLPKINQEALALLSVPIAPLAEQRRIVAAVEQLLERLSSARERLKRVPNTMKRFREAIIAKACSGELTADWREANGHTEDTTGREPEGFLNVPGSWEWVTLGAIADVKGGVTKGRKIPSNKRVEIPYLRVANVQDGYLDLSEIKLIPALEEDRTKYALEPGDILFIEGGNREHLGRGTVWRGEISGCIHQNHVFRARLRRQDVLSEFISLAAKSEHAREYFFSNASQTVNLASINLRSLSALPLPLPTANEQGEIVRRATVLLDLADVIENRAKSALQRVVVLPQAILAKAFRGQLVPTEAELALKEGQSYEPASELLARLRTDSNGEAKWPRSKKTPKRPSVSDDGLLEFMES